MLGAVLAARRFGIRAETTLVATVHAQHMYGLELSIMLPLAEGGFRLLGRSRDMLKVAGKRASLADLNLKLMGTPGVLDGVFVAPEEDGAEVGQPAAVVVAPGMARESLLQELRRLVDPAFLPRPLVFVDSLPRNAAGKLPRQRLLELIGNRPRSGPGSAPC